ncbi:MAG: alcohol dehydrogenase, partial [Ilumatobacteraceae bacterium]|nr:alcohol dehydrogenase [Ilumatobacteraceae bacterium]
PPTEGGRFTLGGAGRLYQERYWNERMFQVVQQLGPLAAEAGVSMATMAVQWVLANPTVTSPIIGASRPEQLADSLAATESPMDPALKARLDEMTHEFRFGDHAR